MTDFSESFGAQSQLLPRRFSAQIRDWPAPFRHLIIIANAASPQLGLFAATDDWHSVDVDENSRPTLPSTSDGSDASVVGMALDLTDAVPRTGADGEAKTPAPWLYAFTHDGVLAAWRMQDKATGTLYPGLAAAQDLVAGPTAPAPVPVAAPAPAFGASAIGSSSIPAIGRSPFGAAASSTGGSAFGTGGFGSSVFGGGGPSTFGAAAKPVAPISGKAFSFAAAAGSTGFGASANKSAFGSAFGASTPSSGPAWASAGSTSAAAPSPPTFSFGGGARTANSAAAAMDADDEDMATPTAKPDLATDADELEPTKISRGNPFGGDEDDEMDDAAASTRMGGLGFGSSAVKPEPAKPAFAAPAPSTTPFATPAKPSAFAAFGAPSAS